MGSIAPATLSRRKVQQEDIDNLQTSLANTGTNVILPEHGELYKAAIARWSMAASKPAGIVIQPSTAEEVGAVLKYARDKNIEFAVTGGGHSTAGASSTDGGIMMSLQHFRRVVLEDWSEDSSQKVFRIGGGANWQDVDDEGVKHGFHTVGGTVADTGVGGLTLGGGYGWLSGLYGLSIDCLVEAEVVLASGEVVRASGKENPDLFWAVCGAGQNFGVVTEFVMKAFPQGEIWCGMVLFDTKPGTIDKVVKVFNDIYTPDETGHTKYQGKAMGGLGFISPPPAQGAIMTFCTIIWLGTQEEGERAWKPLLDIGPVMNTMAMQPYPVANKFQSPPSGLRCSLKGSSFQMPLKTSFVLDVQRMHADFLTTDPEERGNSAFMYEMYDPYVTTISNKGSFANRGTHFNALICPIWKSAERDIECRQWARDLNERFKKELETSGNKTSQGNAGEGVAPRGKKGAVMLYGNYDQYQSSSSDLFGENYPRLQKLKARYDPENVFNRLFPIEPRA